MQKFEPRHAWAAALEGTRLQAFSFSANGIASIDFDFVDITSQNVAIIDISSGHVVQTRIERHETSP